MCKTYVYVKNTSSLIRKLIIIKYQVSCIHTFNANPIKIPVLLWGRSTQNILKFRFICKNKWTGQGKQKNNKMNRNLFWQTLKCHKSKLFRL